MPAYFTTRLIKKKSPIQKGSRSVSRGTLVEKVHAEVTQDVKAVVLLTRGFVSSFWHLLFTPFHFHLSQDQPKEDEHSDASDRPAASFIIGQKFLSMIAIYLTSDLSGKALQFRVASTGQEIYTWICSLLDADLIGAIKAAMTAKGIDPESKCQQLFYIVHRNDIQYNYLSVEEQSSFNGKELKQYLRRHGQASGNIYIGMASPYSSNALKIHSTGSPSC
jgi:hypothetical protein